MAAFSTIALVGLAGLSAVSSLSAADDKADAIVSQGEQAAENKSKETRLKAARAQSSFLTSGLTLEGTPMAAIQDIFSTGLEDVNQITTNTKTSAKNAISAGRTEALGALAGGIGGAFGGGDIFGGSTTTGGSLSSPLTDISGQNVGTFQKPFGG